MDAINWKQFKIFKEKYVNTAGLDNFLLLIEFIRTLDNLISPDDMFEILDNDDLSRQMLQKRSLDNPVELQEFLYKNLKH
ncbi:MAG: hypothetical protein AB7S65_01170 [Sulfuricurvum sp.]